MISNQEAIDILLEARAKIIKGWCQGVYARDNQGRMVSSRSPDACEWCVMGAFFTIDRPWFEVQQMLIATINKIYKLEITTLTLQEWNDGLKSKKQLLEVFDQLIGELKAQCN